MDLDNEDKDNNDQDDGDDDNDKGVTENILNPGQKIALDDFQLNTVIGRGSFGKVYLVRHKASGLPYAMKILKKDQLIKKNLLIKT